MGRSSIPPGIIFWFFRIFFFFRFYFYYRNRALPYHHIDPGAGCLFPIFHPRTCNSCFLFSAPPPSIIITLALAYAFTLSASFSFSPTLQPISYVKKNVALEYSSSSWFSSFVFALLTRCTLARSLTRSLTRAHAHTHTHIHTLALHILALAAESYRCASFLFLRLPYHPPTLFLCSCSLSLFSSLLFFFPCLFLFFFLSMLLLAPQHCCCYCYYALLLLSPAFLTTTTTTISNHHAHRSIKKKDPCLVFLFFLFSSLQASAPLFLTNVFTVEC